MRVHICTADSAFTYMGGVWRAPVAAGRMPNIYIYMYVRFLSGHLYKYTNTCSIPLLKPTTSSHYIMEDKELDPVFCSPFPSSTRWWSEETVAVVTGGNKGIGFAVVKKLAEMGLTVILTARDVGRGKQAVETLRSEFGLHAVKFQQLDVADPCSIQAFVSHFQNDFGVLDILVNNAGVSFNEINENSVEHAETVIQTNFYGPKRLTDALLPFFRRSHSVGRILNISSRLGSINRLRNRRVKAMLLEVERLTEEQIEEEVVGKFLRTVKEGTWQGQGWPAHWTDYSVSKLALNAYSRILAERYRGDGWLSVNCFCPGFTQTSMTRGRGTHSADYAAKSAVALALLPPDLLTTGNFYLKSATSSTNISKI